MTTTELTQLTTQELKDLATEAEWTLCNLELTEAQAKEQTLLRRAAKAELKTRNA